jgi:tetratricopeptide (TPR) repeat protein
VFTAKPDGQAESPVVFVPVEAADIDRRRRRRWMFLALCAVVALGIGAISYKVKVDPIHAQEAYDAGLRLLKIARYPQAILNFDRTISLQPKFADAYLMRARALSGDNQTERASRDYTKYIELRPNDATGYIERGTSYMELHDFQSAIADGESAVRVAPNLAAAYNLRGIAVRAMGNPRAALKDFTRAVELAPVEANYFERASTYQVLGEHRLAIADLTELIAFRPDFAPGYFARAKSRIALGEIEAAKEDRRVGRMLDGR